MKKSVDAFPRYCIIHAPGWNKPQRQPPANIGVKKEIMGSLNRVLIALGNVKAFRSYNVTSGMVEVSDAEFVKHLDSTYGDAIICNVGFAPGAVLQQVSPLLFQSNKEEYKEELQMSLQSQLSQGNDVDIDFHA